MEIIMLNILSGSYLVISLYQAIKFKDSMMDCAYHHFISHMFIVGSSVTAINLYVYKGFTMPIVFAIAYILQHVFKENVRLLKTNRWTPDVEEE